MSDPNIDRMNIERSFALIGPFYTACLLKQMQGLEWDEDSVLEEVIEQRRKIFAAL